MSTVTWGVTRLFSRVWQTRFAVKKVLSLSNSNEELELAGRWQLNVQPRRTTKRLNENLGVLDGVVSRDWRGFITGPVRNQQRLTWIHHGSCQESCSTLTLLAFFDPLRRSGRLNRWIQRDWDQRIRNLASHHCFLLLLLSLSWTERERERGGGGGGGGQTNRTVRQTESNLVFPDVFCSWCPQHCWNVWLLHCLFYSARFFAVLLLWKRGFFRNFAHVLYCHIAV